MTVFRLILIFFVSCICSIAIAGPDEYQQKIDAYLSRAEFDSARLFIEVKLDEVDDAELLNALNYQLVKVLFIQSEYNEALKKSFDALDQLKDPKQGVKFNFMVGCIYSAITDYDKSIVYFDLVLDHTQDTSLLVQTHLLSSNLHLELGDSSKALNSLKQAYNITSVSTKDSKMKEHVAMQFNFFSKNYELCKMQNIQVIEDSTSFLSSKSYAYSMVGDCLVEQDSLAEAATFYEEFLKLTFETQDPEQIKIAAQKLIDLYEKMGLQETANAYHRIYNEAESDSLSFSIEKYREIYEVEKNRELAISMNKSRRNTLLIGLSILLALVFIYYSFLKVKQTQNSTKEKALGKKIVVSDAETKKIELAINKLIAEQSYLTSNISRKSFSLEHQIKSERYLSHYINEKYNKSFSVFINDLRIEYAYNRIRNDSVFRNYKIEEIARLSGFGSKKTFERAFFANFQETPFKIIAGILE